MGTPFIPTRRGVRARACLNLTPLELEICALHLIDGHSQTLIAEWLGTSVRAVRIILESAVQIVPALQPLRVKSQQKPRRPRITPFSQLKGSDRRGAFNSDEL